MTFDEWFEKNYPRKGGPWFIKPVLRKAFDAGYEEGRGDPWPPNDWLDD